MGLEGCALLFLGFRDCSGDSAGRCARFFAQGRGGIGDNAGSDITEEDRSMRAREIMTEEPIFCTPMDSVRSVAKQMADNMCGLLPVVDNMDSMHLIGVITDRDIVCRILANDSMDCAHAVVQDAMTTGRLWTVTADSSVDEVIEKMEDGQVRRIPVVNEDNVIVGIIATADIALEIDDEEEIAEVFEEISEPSDTPRA